MEIAVLYKCGNNCIKNGVINVEKEQFLKGLKNRGLCSSYASKFKNTYVNYIEKEKKSRQDFIYEHMISEDEFWGEYEEDWDESWFYLGDDIVQFYNEMGWDFNKLSASKNLLYSRKYGSSYKNYVIQDIWDNLINESDCEYLCWGVFNFIGVLQETDEQRELKSELKKFMDELYQYTVDESQLNVGTLSKYIKENNGIDCTFGHIKIDINNRLGQGGNGIVFSGLLSETEVAVKFLVNYTHKKLERFKAEYINVNMARERLCNVVNYLHYETLKFGSAEVPFIVMKKYNMSLKKQRDDIGDDVRWEDLLKLFKNLCKAIKSLEQNSITHRDLKPENILVDENGNYIITDFGIAHFESEIYPIKGLTKKNDRMANWQFSAPEQVSGEKITFATDIYAMGEILYWFCFGEINRGTGGKHLQEIFDEEQVTVLDNIIYKSISNQPEDRYQSIQEIEEEFNSVQKKNVDVYADMHLFSRAIRSIFPEAYKNPFVTDNKEHIKALITRLNETKFNRELWYNTGLANEEFREIKSLKNGNYLLCNREIIIDEIWSFINDSNYADILILKVSNPDYYVVDGRKCGHIAIINNEIKEPFEKIISGYYRFQDGHVEPVSNLTVEERYTYKEIDDDKYIVIGVQHHCSIIQDNDSSICKIQEFDELNPEIIRRLRKEISKHKTYEVQLGI